MQPSPGNRRLGVLSGSYRLVETSGVPHQVPHGVSAGSASFYEFLRSLSLLLVLASRNSKDGRLQRAVVAAETNLEYGKVRGQPWEEPGLQDQPVSLGPGSLKLLGWG